MAEEAIYFLRCKTGVHKHYVMCEQEIFLLWHAGHGSGKPQSDQKQNKLMFTLRSCAGMVEGYLVSGQEILDAGRFPSWF